MPAKKKPAAKKPAAKKPAAKKPAAKKAAAKKTAAKAKPAAKAAAKAKPAKKSEAPPASKVVVREGQKAPALSLPGDDGATHSLADHKGAPVVVYFYPRDDTPGCTVEACDFRDNLARATAKGAVVYGVSRDSLASHARFKSKHNLNFTLLSDPSLETHVAWGAWGEKVMYGQKTLGVIRSTYLVAPDGTIAKAWPKVKVAGHVDEVLQAIDAL